MPHNLQCEAITKFLIPDHPQQDNYPDPDEWEEKEKVAEAKCSVEAACVAVEKQKLRCEVAEHKQMTAAQKKVGMIMDVLASGSLICARCRLKGLSSYFFSAVG